MDSWNDNGDMLSHSPTVKISASDFVGRYLTLQVLQNLSKIMLVIANNFIIRSMMDCLQNTQGKSGKCVALRVTGDRVAFYGCRIISYQDTLLDDPVDTTTKIVTLKELKISHLEMQPLFSK